jgi:hypothetical protein
MAIQYWSVSFFQKSGTAYGSFEENPGFTNDPALHSKCVALKYRPYSDHAKERRRWGADTDDDTRGSADSLDACKAMLGADAEETPPGCWSTRGRK